MKKFILVAVFAILFTVPSFSQYDEMEDSVTVMWDEAYTPDLSESEKAMVKKLLSKNSSADIVYDDNCGCIIYKTNRGKYNYINIRISKEVILKDMDNIDIIDITGCGLEDGITTLKDGKVAVYTLKGEQLIPPVSADKLVSVVKNPFKSTQNSAWGYAIAKKDKDYYAVSTQRSILSKLDMDKCSFMVNIIIGYKGDDIYVYTPDGSEKEEFVFNTNDKDVEYLEVEILETNGHGRYEYEGTKYNNITPGLVVKKGMNYILYPGGNKLTVHKNGDILVGKTGSQKVIFSPPYSIAMDAKTTIAAMTE